MNIKQQIEGYCEEAKVDFFSMADIAGNVHFYQEVNDFKDVKIKSLEIVKALMERDIFPGNYTLESLKREGFSFWPGTPDELIRRIEDAWTALDRMPDVDDICWFALKPSAKA